MMMGTSGAASSALRDLLALSEFLAALQTKGTQDALKKLLAEREATEARQSEIETLRAEVEREKAALLGQREASDRQREQIELDAAALAEKADKQKAADAALTARETEIMAALKRLAEGRGVLEAERIKHNAEHGQLMSVLAARETELAAAIERVAQREAAAAARQDELEERLQRIKAAVAA